MITACGDGRSYEIGTRRRRSHGHTAKAVVTSTSQNVGARSREASSDRSPRWLSTNSSVLAHTSRSATQPQNRWVTSKRSCCLVRSLGRAVTTMTVKSVTIVNPTTTFACDTLPTPALASWSSDTTNTRYQSVPAIAPPTWRPPKW